jgi:1-acyl-sn-glycerol-3-phosphate acyltransferase
MLIVRSLLFNTAFYLNLIAWLIVFIPTFFMPRMAYIRAAQGWARSSLWLLKVIAGVRAEFRGLERIPPGGAILAVKHQSVWETFALFTIVNDPAYVLKRELMWIPLFGWYAWKGGMVPINRRGGSAALAALNERAKAEVVGRRRQLLIFPEGTRRAPGAEPSYKYGIAHLYASLDAPLVPVALNSGLFWPRRKFLRHPGTVVLEVLEPIPPGLPKEEAFRLIQSRIEEASDRLLAEGRAELARLAPPPGPAGDAARP